MSLALRTQDHYRLKDPFRATDQQDPAWRDETPVLGTPTYSSWRQVPRDLRTRQSWRKRSRRVRKGSTPLDYRQFTTESGRQGYLSLYPFTCTEPYTPTERTKAVWEYQRLFLGHSRRDDYLKIDHKQQREGAAPDWHTFRDTGELYFQSLGEKAIRSHLNHSSTYGCKSNGGLTNFLIIDLDYHDGDRDVFLEMSEKLIETFYGHDTWHMQVNPDNLQGVHYIKVFKEPVLLDWAINDTLEKLGRLDLKYPDLARRAHLAGMKSFSGLELYPAVNKGVRLPLGKDRWVILDDYVPPIIKGKRLVGDVERYVKWLKDSDRKHRSPEHVMEFLKAYTPDEPQHREKAKKSRRQPSSADSGYIKPTNWKRQFRRLRNDMFLNGNSNGIPLNTHLIVLARCSLSFGKTPEQIKAGLMDLLTTLPECAKPSSSRLSTNNTAALSKQVDWVVKIAFGYQQDPLGSQRIWAKVTQTLKSLGEDPLDKTTWIETSTPKKIQVQWSEQERLEIYRALAPRLCVYDSTTLFAFCAFCVNLVNSRERKPTSLGYFRKCFGEHFPSIRFGNHSKLSSAIGALMALGVITRTNRGYQGTSSTYTLGPLSIGAISRAKDHVAKNSRSTTTHKISSATLRRSWRGLVRPHHIGKEKTHSFPLPLFFPLKCHQKRSIKWTHNTSICSHPIHNPHLWQHLSRGPPICPLVMKLESNQQESSIKSQISEARVRRKTENNHT